MSSVFCLPTAPFLNLFDHDGPWGQPPTIGRDAAALRELGRSDGRGAGRLKEWGEAGRSPRSPHERLSLNNLTKSFLLPQTEMALAQVDA